MREDLRHFHAALSVALELERSPQRGTGRAWRERAGASAAIGWVAIVSIVVIGATNHADRLDPALVRPGRLNRVITILHKETVGGAILLAAAAIALIWANSPWSGSYVSFWHSHVGSPPLVGKPSRIF